MRCAVSFVGRVLSRSAPRAHSSRGFCSAAAPSNRRGALKTALGKDAIPPVPGFTKQVFIHNTDIPVMVPEGWHTQALELPPVLPLTSERVYSSVVSRENLEKQQFFEVGVDISLFAGIREGNELGATADKFAGWWMSSKLLNMNEQGEMEPTVREDVHVKNVWKHQSGKNDALLVQGADFTLKQRNEPDLRFHIDVVSNEEKGYFAEIRFEAVAGNFDREWKEFGQKIKEKLLFDFEKFADAGKEPVSDRDPSAST